MPSTLPHLSLSLLSSVLSPPRQSEERKSKRSGGRGKHGKNAAAMRLLVPDGARQHHCGPSEAPALLQPPPSPAPAAGNRRTIVVGIRRDAASRELLTWALVKVANAGDHVVALHVSAGGEGRGGLGLEEKSKAADPLVSVLAVYDGFCNLRQINLELKICGGSSIRKILVKEAVSYGAAHLILGVAKNSRSFGSSSTSVAKYCAKRVPTSCSVLAVDNGKIVYHRDAAQQEQYLSASTIAETPRRSYRKLLTYMIGEKLQDECVKDNRSISRADTMPMRSPASPKEVSLALVPVKGCRRGSPEVATGWALLRKKFLPDRKAALPDKSKMSVVQWAMRLPSRYSAVSPVHLEHRTTRPDSTTSASRILRDRVVVPSRNNSGRSSVVIEELDKEIPEELSSLKEKFSSIYSLYSYSELAKITSDFSPECIVGQGGTSQVYSGCLANGKEIAVKILKYSNEVLKEFISEIEIVSSLSHKNIISLIGFCFKNNDLLLVYEYLQRGNLEEILHGDKECKNVFGWTKRFNVAVGVAHALDYLHGNGNSCPVIHRDIKSSNILISEDFEPKLSDFGLALWAANATSQITCNDVAGTFGYLAPEYFMHGKMNDKIDVYAFGVVLLELISGRKPLCTSCPKGRESLVMWANSIIQGGKLTQLVDPSLPTEGHTNEVERMTLAASLCIRPAPQHRPHIAVGGYVLYCLFKKQEEKNERSCPEEMDRSGYSPTPSRSTPDNMEANEEANTPLHKESPESALHESPVDLPGPIETQAAPITRWLADRTDNLVTNEANISNMPPLGHVDGGAKVGPSVGSLAQLIDP